MAEQVAVEGCQHCGIAFRDHCQSWHPSVGWHGWAAPTREQIRDRMRSNRGMDTTRTRLTDSGRAEVWIDDPAPGGWVCGEPVAHHPDGICGMPTESEPCSEHPPQTDAERAELLRAVVAERFGTAGESA